MSTIASHLNEPVGYTCQTWLAEHIAEEYFGGAYRVWFATSINPPHNGSSSNPLVIYQELDRIVHTNDHHHSRIEQLRRRLSNWVHASTRLRSGAIVDLINEITMAPVCAFRPRIWSIDLAKIKLSRLIQLGQFPDEYQIRDLVAGEFTVVTQ